jgi:hypothetical protein
MSDTKFTSGKWVSGKTHDGYDIIIVINVARVTLDRIREGRN